VTNGQVIGVTNIGSSVAVYNPSTMLTLQGAPIGAARFGRGFICAGADTASGSPWGDVTAGHVLYWNDGSIAINTIVLSGGTVSGFRCYDGVSLESNNIIVNPAVFVKETKNLLDQVAELTRMVEFLQSQGVKYSHADKKHQKKLVDYTRGAFNQEKFDRCDHDFPDCQGCPCWYDAVEGGVKSNWKPQSTNNLLDDEY